MTKLRVQAQHRLNFRFLSRKSHSSVGVKFLQEKVGNGQKVNRPGVSEVGASGSKVVTKHLSSITILPRKDSLPEDSRKTSQKMDNQSPDSIETKTITDMAECGSQEALDVLRQILETQRLNSTEVYSLSGCSVRIEVLEDTDL